MPSFRALSKSICLVLVGVFLFAQLAVAGYACPGFGQPVGQTVDLKPVDSDSAMPGGCDQMDPQAANLCAEHCKFGQQSSNPAPAPLAMAPMSALRYVLPAVDIGGIEAAGVVQAPDPLLAAAPPPHTILHCVLRI